MELETNDFQFTRMRSQKQERYATQIGYVDGTYRTKGGGHWLFCFVFETEILLGKKSLVHQFVSVKQTPGCLQPHYRGSRPPHPPLSLPVHLEDPDQ